MDKEKNNLRLPPQNTDAERALLGAILLRPGTIHEVADMVTPESFYTHQHRTIFECILELHSHTEPIDLLSLSSKLKSKSLLEQAGGHEYLAALTTSVPSATNAAHYAKMVFDKSAMRNLIDAGSHVAELGFAEDKQIEEVMDEAERKIFSVTQSPKGNKFTNIKEILPQSWEAIEKLSDSDDEIRGVPTGFSALDNKLSGLQKSDMVILAARPSMGKTSLALDIARQAALVHGKRVGIFSLEMSSQQLVDRMLSAQAKVDAWKLRTGMALDEGDYANIRDAMSELSQAPIYIDDQPGNNILRMRSTARRLKREHGLDLIVIDYLQLITTTRHYDNIVNQVTEISRSIKSLAREMEAPVLCLSQLSRAVEQRGGKPRLSDLRDSGSIEQDADVVMFIHNETRFKAPEERSNVTQILIEKHRNGPTGEVELYFDNSKTTFLNLENSGGYDNIDPNDFQSQASVDMGGFAGPGDISFDAF